MTHPTLPPPAVIAAEFVAWLESRGAALGLDVADELRIDLNGIPGMTFSEADEIAQAIFEIRDEIRAACSSYEERGEESLGAPEFTTKNSVRQLVQRYIVVTPVFRTLVVWDSWHTGHGGMGRWAASPDNVPSLQRGGANLGWQEDADFAQRGETREDDTNEGGRPLSGAASRRSADGLNSLAAHSMKQMSH